jgi:hypothetical protein
VILYYAPGAGLGHLSRAIKFISGKLHDSPVILLGTSRHATVINDSLPTNVQYKQLLTAELSTEGFRRQLAQFSAELVLVDAFPAGINGEIQAPCDCPAWHLARRLKWQQYEPLIQAPLRFERTFLLEKLDASHHTMLIAQSESVTRTPLPQITSRLDSLNRQELLAHFGLPSRLADAPFGIIAHAGSFEETQQLIDYADELHRYGECGPCFVVATPIASARNHQTHGLKTEFLPGRWPVSSLFHHAELVVSGAGFNIVNEMTYNNVRHRVLPFERRWDDQFSRARQVRS